MSVLDQCFPAPALFFGNMAQLENKNRVQHAGESGQGS